MDILFFSRASVAAVFLSGVAHAAPQWIWAAPHNGATPDQAVFRHEIEVAEGVKRAVLRVAADNAARVLINGREVVTNDSWSDPSRADVVRFLRPGKNELKVEAKNDAGSPAGLVVSLALTGADDKRTVVETNDQWMVSTVNPTVFQPVVVLGAMGVDPWGDVFGGGRGATASVVAGSAVQTLPGFKAELLYTVPKDEQGSWVSMTTDPQGRIIAGDQYGGLFRITPPAIGAEVDPSATKVEKLSSTIGGAHGLLWAFDSLYAVVAERPTSKSEPGLWRLRDEDHDGVFEKEEHLLRLDGGGEHGPHSVVLSPDGTSLFIACGNHTKPPKLDASRAARAWQEDHLLPRMWDANGHAVNIMAPGGYIVKTDPEGRQVEMFCYGFRNQFDISFNTEGDLYTFDSDMEWDMGTPWYRPTRIVHCVSGADYGWRSGSGKWPDYYPDSLPPTYDIGPGSPTGVTFGTGACFPAKYQAAFFACDWTYGTMYAVHLRPDGATHRAEVEEFVSGKPLPLTDLLIHPKDGAMYFAIGGRKTQSALYRVTYTGPEKAEPMANPIVSDRMARPQPGLRRSLEKLHGAPTDGSAAAEVVEKAWPSLADDDRFVRYAARVAIERQPADAWVARLRDEARPNAVIEGCVALARVSQRPDTQDVILAKLGGLVGHDLTVDQRLAALRALQLTLIRQGKPDGQTTEQINRMLGERFPSTDDLINRELCQILVALGDSGVVPKTLQLMAVARESEGVEAASAQLLARNEQYARDVQGTMAGRPNRQQFALAWWLRAATNGWTPELRRQYFAWFPTTRKWRGGNSFHGFIENARKEALALVPESERAALDALSTKVDEPAILTFTPPKGPGRPYTVDDIMKFADGRITGRNFASGKNLYDATACSTCHRFNGDGGGLGPDLTGTSNRYTLRDLLENLIEPSKVISDQYESTQIELMDGRLLVGRVMKEEAGVLHVAMNPLAPSELVPVPANTVAARKPYPISMMPPGLLNQLNEEEVLDLLAFLLSGGNPDDKVFAK
jgi:putative heme-binding domain-containing protein